MLFAIYFQMDHVFMFFLIELEKINSFMKRTTTPLYCILFPVFNTSYYKLNFIIF